MKWLVSAVVLALVACGDDPVCAPNQQLECACPDGPSGFQTCNEEGSGFEPCVCEDEPQGGGGSGGGSGGSGGAGSCSDDDLPGVQLPCPPVGAQAGDGEGARLRVTTFYVGGRTREGTPSDVAWREFGYDLDGVVTTDDFAGHCLPSSGGIPSNVFVDGEDGRDNAFGKSVLPLLSVAGDFDDVVNDSIANGTFTLIFDLANVGQGADYSAIDGYVYEGREGSGNTWRVAPEPLADPSNANLETALHSTEAAAPESYVSDQVWVSGPVTGVVIQLGDIPLRITPRIAFVTMTLSADRSSASEGVIAGVIDKDELIEEIERYAGTLNPDFCDPNNGVIQGILNQVRQSADIMNDGTQSTSQCNGISFGFGFEAGPVNIAGVGDPTSLENSCDDFE